MGSPVDIRRQELQFRPLSLYPIFNFYLTYKYSTQQGCSRRRTAFFFGPISRQLSTGNRQTMGCLGGLPPSPPAGSTAPCTPLHRSPLGERGRNSLPAPSGNSLSRWHVSRPSPSGGLAASLDTTASLLATISNTI